MKGGCIFQKGDPGGVLNILVEGEVSIELEKRSGSTRLATVKKSSFFGEMTFFDNRSQTSSAVALTGSQILEMQREPILNLSAQNPELALELIYVLSQRVRENSEQLGKIARSHPRELYKLYDQLNY